MEILQNTFVKAIVVPIILAIAATLLEAASALVKGKCKGQQKFRIWVKQKEPDNNVIIVPILGQTLQTIQKRKDIVDVETMVNFDLADFGTLGIDLIIGAFAVDVASLINTKSNTILIGYILIGHVLMLIGIVLFLALGHLASPEEQSEKRGRAAVAISLGLVAMMIAFFAA